MSICTKVSLIPKEPHWAALVEDSYYFDGDKYPYLKYIAFATANEIYNWLQFQTNVSVIKILYVEPHGHKTVIEIDGVIQ